MKSAPRRVCCKPSICCDEIRRKKNVTGDAMLVQRELSLQIVRAGGDYLWTVKANQSTLYDDIAALFAPERVTKGCSAPKKELRQAVSVEKGHGRLEVRRLTASRELKTYLGWPYAEQVFRVERTFTRQVDGKRMHEISFGITSLTPREADAARLLALVREHWQIENGLHYRRDVTFREDWGTLRRGYAPQLMAALNNLVLGFIRRTGKNKRPKRAVITMPILTKLPNCSCAPYPGFAKALLPISTCLTKCQN